MKWKNSARELYQISETGKACEYYYIWRESAGKWRAGRYWLKREINFRLEFSSAKIARWYCEQYDKDLASTIIEGVTA